MADLGREGRSSRPPAQIRSRRKWLLAAAAVAIWIFLLYLSGSLVGGTVLLVLLAVGLVVIGLMLWMLGFNMQHPMVQAAASRPWRDGRDVLRLALRHLSEVFIITPNGSLLAPNAVELRMNPADVDSLSALIDLRLVNENAAEAYAAEVKANSARIVKDMPIEVCVAADPLVPRGRFRLRQRTQRGPVEAISEVISSEDDGRTSPDSAVALTVLSGDVTDAESAPCPMLRLVTMGSVAETRISPARAGRGRAAELRLPGGRTMSRVHARFTCTGGEWWITCLGRNGLVLNGTALTGNHVVRNGDSIQWGRQPDALLSRVEIA